jgi:hypothetical protein
VVLIVFLNRADGEIVTAADHDLLVSARQIGLALCANNYDNAAFLGEHTVGGCVFRWGRRTVVKPLRMGIQVIPRPPDSCLGSWQPQSPGQRTLADRQTDEGLQALRRSPGGHTRLLKLGTSIGQLGRYIARVSVRVKIRMDIQEPFFYRSLAIRALRFYSSSRMML